MSAALFIDGANTYSTTRALDIDLDYSLLYDYCEKTWGGGTLVQARYYTATKESPDGAQPLRTLLDWLEYNRYSVVAKPLKEYTDSNGVKRWRGNMNIELALDAIGMVSSLKTFVLMSGNSDFCRLLQDMQQHGVRTVVISTLMTDPPSVADDLRRQADIFVDLDSLRDVVSR